MKKNKKNQIQNRIVGGTKSYHIIKYESSKDVMFVIADDYTN